MIAQKRDLRTGTPVWAEYSQPRVKVLPLPRSLSIDVAIIGAGISGAMMAEALSGQGMEVAVFDKRKPLSGSTSASTALLQYEIDTPLTKLRKDIGQENAARAWRRSKLGLESLAVKIQDLNIDCAFDRRDSLYLSGNVLNEKQLEEECRQRTAIGLPGIMLDKQELAAMYGVRAKAALLSRNNIACNPVQLAAGFLKSALTKGAVVYSPVDIDTLSHKKNHIVLNTADGGSIKTRYVIFTTGYEIPRYTKTKKHKIFSTWAISTKPVKGLPTDLPFVWEAADPYIYCRTTADGRMIFGGEDEEFSDSEKRDALIPTKKIALERKLHKLFPDYAFVTEHAWTGSFGASTTGLPSIGKIPGHKNCYAVMAYGGNGITFSRIAAEIVAADIAGYKDPDAALFAFQTT